ncbi:MAG: EamA/RhaT family transporter, partial [Lactobacillus crispatus]|nr:EamA/RhaT family transporter [Lactobacillus crispatus]
GSVICFGLVMTPMDWIGSILVVLAAMALNISPKKKKVKKTHQ